MSVLLSATSVGFQRGGKTILQDADIQVSSQEIVTLIGPNGAGKTTLVRLLLGLMKPDSGAIQRSKDLVVGYMPQKLNIDNTMPLSVQRFLALTGQKSGEINNALARVGVGTLKKQSMVDLSGGETQRVLLARALLRKPNLLVLDEPVQGVDVAGQAQLYDLIAELRDELSAGVLMISHDLHLVMAKTDTVVCLNKHVCCHGHPEAVTAHPAYLELFGQNQSASVAVYTHHHDHTHDHHGDVHTDTHSHCTDATHSH
ncbi:zinc ABC transporter ATP-binding protein ZnuC [Marinibactrum halimedae]|uniref:Zinc import ATP-binding protein ZnuC n=1 Tax=Marinibactrum halimedae TaxID=1444977 RepID=A0AA37T3X1_9GAMM|nr:zinc ABC transporter ATP-binding protein ZnuC [Marinibactrum halimedae]MCD9460912.1 zinc ABC transporter ATP-binding protein ZnuC [Marinibactrum halimedae]GLS24587.1 zinc import ATP-binding protein ZnuC [Marinibactrum halimedae]